MMPAAQQNGNNYYAGRAASRLQEIITDEPMRATFFTTEQRK